MLKRPTLCTHFVWEVVVGEGGGEVGCPNPLPRVRPQLGYTIDQECSDSRCRHHGNKNDLPGHLPSSIHMKDRSRCRASTCRGINLSFLPRDKRSKVFIILVLLHVQHTN